MRQSRRWNQRIDTVLIVPGQAARLSRPRRPAIRTTDGHRKNLNKIVFKNKQLQYLLRGLLGALALTSALVAAQTPTADECRQKHLNDPVAQVICARQAYLAAPASEAQPASPLTSPLANTQVIFGFYDRRFPGFNNGLEHLGVDFSTAAGAAVAAICDGTVVFNNTSQASIGAAVVMVEHDCAQPLGDRSAVSRSEERVGVRSLRRPPLSRVEPSCRPRRDDVQFPAARAATPRRSLADVPRNSKPRAGGHGRPTVDRAPGLVETRHQFSAESAAPNLTMQC